MRVLKEEEKEDVTWLTFTLRDLQVRQPVRDLE